MPLTFLQVSQHMSLFPISEALYMMSPCLACPYHLSLYYVGLSLLHLTENSTKLAYTEKEVITESSSISGLVGLSPGTASSQDHVSPALRSALDSAAFSRTCRPQQCGVPGKRASQVQGQGTRVPPPSQYSQQGSHSTSLPQMVSRGVLKPITRVRKHAPSQLRPNTQGCHCSGEEIP